MYWILTTNTQYTVGSYLVKITLRSSQGPRTEIIYSGVMHIIGVSGGLTDV